MLVVLDWVVVFDLYVDQCVEVVVECVEVFGGVEVDVVVIIFGVGIVMD